MSNVLPIYGVEVAISKLYPNATYQLEGTTFTKWEDPSGSAAPAWSKIMEQIQIDKKEADSIQAAHKAVADPIAEAVNSVNILPNQLRPDVQPDLSSLIAREETGPGVIEIAPEFKQ